MKKFICWAIIIIIIITNIIVITEINKNNNTITYDDVQNTNTIVEMLQSVNTNIKDRVHIQKIKYNSLLLDIELTITYIEDGKSKEIKKIISKDNMIANYVAKNMTNLTEEIIKIQKIFNILYLFMFFLVIENHIKK